LLLEIHGCATEKEMNRNTSKTLKRGYEGIQGLIEKSSGDVSIVGSGPSIKDSYKELKGDVFAINSAIGFLLDKGIVPKWAMLWDASPLVAQFARPHKGISYLVAARCHPSVFRRLKNQKIYSWFAGGDHNINEYMIEKQLYDPVVNGGSAGVTRAMYLATALGYSHLHIFGGDSSYNDDGETHINGSLVEEKDIIVWIGKEEGKQAFRTTPEWCSQVNEFRDIYHLFSHPLMNINIDSYGEGMLQRMCDLMEARKTENLLWDEDGKVVNPSENVVKAGNFGTDEVNNGTNISE